MTNIIGGIKSKIRQELSTYQIQIMQLERNANDGTMTRDEAVKGFNESLDIFTDRIYGIFQDIGKEIVKLFELGA